MFSIEQVAEEFLGRRFGTLLVKEVMRVRRSRESTWGATVVCECGVRSVVEVRNLRSGATRTCGSKVHNVRGWSRHSAPSNVIYIPEEHP